MDPVNDQDRREARMPPHVHQYRPPDTSPSPPAAGAARHEEHLSYAREIIRAEAAALQQVAERLDASFLQAVDLLLPMTGAGRGRLAITGTGKSADIGLKLAGTFS